MAGTLRGRIEALINETDEHEQAAAILTNIYEVLDAHPQTTLISLGYGSGGTGTDYPGGANPFGDDAHFVFRFDTHGGRSWPFFVYVTVGSVSGFGAASDVQGDGSAPSSGSGQVFVSAAIGIGGDENPWNGTENADGTDTKPATPWANPGGGGTNVMVVPASNSDSGSDGTNKNNCLLVYNESTAGSAARYHIVADDDAIVFAWSQGDTGDYQVVFFGAITANPGLASYPTPFACWKTTAQTQEVQLSTPYTDDNSGVTDPDTSEANWQASRVQLIGPVQIFEAPYMPNDAEGLFDSFPLGFASDQSGNAGYRGETSFVLTTWGVAAQDTDVAQELFIAGPSSATNNKPVIPWDGATTPGSGVARTGTDFTRTP